MGKFSIVKVTADKFDMYRQSIIDLWKDNLSNGTLKRFEWLYYRNPAGQPVTWLAKDNETGQFVGCNSLYPRDVWIAGTKFRMGIAIDFAVNSPYRVFGPALMLEKNIVQQFAESGFDFVVAWPSAASLGLFLRAGYEVLSDIEIRIKVIRSRSKIVAKIKNQLTGTILAFLYDNIFLLSEYKHCIFRSNNLIGKHFYNADHLFDKLWDSSSKDHGIVGIRNSTFIEWRYFSNPTKKYLCFALENTSTDSIFGYLIYSRESNHIFLWDVFLIDDRCTKYFFDEFAVVMKKQGVESITLIYSGNKISKEFLSKRHYGIRKVKRPCVVHWGTLSDQFIQEVKNTNNWLMVEGEMDL